MIRVLLAPLTHSHVVDFIEDIRSSVFEELKRVFEKSHVEVYVWTDIVKPTIKCFDWSRIQYYAPCLLKWLKEVFNGLSEDYYVVGIGYLDGYDTGLNFVFGEASPSLRSAIVFTRRLDPEFYGLKHDYSLYLDRVRKEVIHELGHLLGLSHCRKRECVMSFSNSVFEVDRKDARFCNECVLKLRKTLAPQF
ncbi:MAG: archaemetzincin family Zn-dependent metalloprotease [Thermoprotei archaeon]